MAATSQIKEKFEDYDGFVEKFVPKKTTDDCYTPDAVYQAVKAWACREYSIDPETVVRPFWPGADYTAYEYKPEHVVIDNPPFSIVSAICKWYVDKGIRFFLFAPYLSNFNCGYVPEIQHIIVDCSVIYDNGAVVPTCFLTNMDSSFIRTAPDLQAAMQAANVKPTKTLPKYYYPVHVLKATDVGHLAKYSIDFRLPASDCYFVRALDSQRPAKKTIFGAGFLLSERAAAERAAAERAAAERAAAERWSLSDREWNIIHGLGDLSPLHS